MASQQVTPATVGVEEVDGSEGTEACAAKTTHYSVVVEEATVCGSASAAALADEEVEVERESMVFESGDPSAGVEVAIVAVRDYSRLTWAPRLAAGGGYFTIVPTQE